MTKRIFHKVEVQLDLSALDTISETVDKEIKAFEEDEQSKKLERTVKTENLFGS